MRRTLEIRTQKREELIDITREVEEVVRASGVRDGLVALYVQGERPDRFDPGSALSAGARGSDAGRRTRACHADPGGLPTTETTSRNPDTPAPVGP